MTILAQHALLIAILLWFSGCFVGVVASVPLTMLYVYRKGQAMIAQRDEAKEGEVE